MAPMPRHDLKVSRGIIRDNANPDRLLLTIQAQAVLEFDELRIALEKSSLVTIESMPTTGAKLNRSSPRSKRT